MHLVSAHILYPFWKLRSFRKWDKGMDINPEDKTSYTTQYQEASLKYVENESRAKHRRLPVTQSGNIQNNNLSFSAMASKSGQSLYDPYDLSSDDGEYLMPNNVADTTPGRSDCTARLLTAASLYLNSPRELPPNWGQNNPNLNDYHCNPMEISRKLWLPEITDWWRQQEEMHWKYADLSNVARDIFYIIPHGVGVEASFSLGWDVIRWRQLKFTGERPRENVVVRQFARATNWLQAGDDPVSDSNRTENDMEMNREVQEHKLHRMAMVHNFLEMCQGSQKLRATQKESRAQNQQMTAVGYIPDTEEIVKVSWSNFQHDCAAAFELSENHLCHQLCLPRTSLEDERKDWMSAESNESTAILPKVIWISHLNAFQTPKIGFTGMGTWIIQMPVKTTARQTMNQTWNCTMALTIPKPRSSGMLVPHQLFVDWSGLYDDQRSRLKWRWWRLI